MKLLLNAEAFGFGPSAAIAGLFPSLKQCSFITQLDYAGDGHSLDLQRHLDYHHVFTIENKEEFIRIVKSYDFFITALDFEKASWAHEQGVKVIIYDTLLWYWRKIPPIIQNCHAYLVQDFYTVKETIEKLNLKNYDILPAGIESKKSLDADTIIINFGGLENPHWDILVSVQYIGKILNCLSGLFNERVIVLCSKSHIPHLKEFENKYEIKNCTYLETQQLLQRCKLLIATPGLGNIYESASYQMPSLFLPPANDSQGQQMKILKDNNIFNNSIDWDSIDYKKPQQEVLHSIEQQINSIESEKLIQLFKEKLNHCDNQLSTLSVKFGQNGKQCFSQKVIEVLQK